MDCTAPLTTPKPAAKAGLAIPDPVAFAKQLGGLKLGALVGLAVAAVAQWLEPGPTPLTWSDGPFALESMVVGMAVQGLLHLTLGWYVDPKLHQLRAGREADLQLAELERAEASGILEKEECARIRARITRRKIAGGFKARRKRGPNKLPALAALSTRPLTVPPPRPPDSDRGWGLRFTDRLASSWAADRDDRARVWFELPLSSS